MQASNLTLNYLLNSLSGGVKHLHWFHNLSSFFFIFLQIKDFRQFVKTIYNIDFIIFLHFSRLRTFSNSSRRSTTPSPATCPRSSSRAVRSRSRTSPRSTWTPYWPRPSPQPPYWPTKRTPTIRTFPWVFFFYDCEATKKICLFGISSRFNEIPTAHADKIYKQKIK